MRADREGFTLIELLIVVVIIGILATIAIGQFDRVRGQAYHRIVKNDLRTLAIQQEMYHHTQGTYGLDVGVIAFQPSAAVDIEIKAADQRGWAAVASHPGWPGNSCGIFVGDDHQSEAGPATTIGVVQCTGE